LQIAVDTASGREGSETDGFGGKGPQSGENYSSIVGEPIHFWPLQPFHASPGQISWWGNLRTCDKRVCRFPEIFRFFGWSMEFLQISELKM